MSIRAHVGIGMTSARTRDRLVQRLREQGIHDVRVLERIRSLPRHIFVDEALASRAYEDTALPIGFGQTISQPYIVARMTQALLSGGLPGKVLEVGFGCGYQTAVLAPFAEKVFAIERVEPLITRTKQRLKDLQIRNVKLKHGDGMKGWPTQAPFDGIIVAAAPLAVPEALVQQLAVGGRLIVPVGTDGQQQLLRITRRENGIHKEVLEKVAFVPLLAGVTGGS
ncbi:MAG: protein-L-isoaspartate(D-aspartate) O-methyltransferase [Steroidobacteraceae bacterium]